MFEENCSKLFLSFRELIFFLLDPLGKCAVYRSITDSLLPNTLYSVVNICAEKKTNQNQNKTEKALELVEADFIL